MQKLEPIKPPRGTAVLPKSAPNARARLLRLAQFVPYLLLACTAYSMFAETVDDPYITFRYAANVLAGHGAVFNVGERVEGYTSPLHLLLSIGMLTVAPSVDILFKAKCASLLFAFVMLAQTGTLARRSGLHAREALLAQALVALNINFALAAVNALETTLYGALLLGSLLLFQKECRRGHGIGSGLLLALALQARPEAFLTVAALLLVRFVWMRRRTLPLSFAAGWLLAFVLPVCLVEIARWSYYGQWVPNTYFAKGAPLGHSLQIGAGYLLKATAPGQVASKLFSPFFHNLAQLGPHNLFAFHSLVQRNLRSDFFFILMPLLFWGLALAGLAATGARRSALRSTAMICLAVLGAVVVFVLRAGGDWMYGWRFVVPTLPVIAIAQCWGVRALGRALTRRGWSFSPGARRFCGAAAAALWLVSAVKTTHYPWSRAHFSTQGSRLLQVSEGYGPLWVKGERYIHLLPRGSKLAYSEMGYSGYSNLDKNMLDVRGLTDREIAHLPMRYKNISGVVDPQWYLPSHPMYQILERRRPDTIMSFNNDPSTVNLKGYRRIDVLPMPTNDKQGLSWVYVYRRL